EDPQRPPLPHRDVAAEDPGGGLRRARDHEPVLYPSGLQTDEQKLQPSLDWDPEQRALTGRGEPDGRSGQRGDHPAIQSRDAVNVLDGMALDLFVNHSLRNRRSVDSEDRLRERWCVRAMRDHLGWKLDLAVRNVAPVYHVEVRH